MSTRAQQPLIKNENKNNSILLGLRFLMQFDAIADCLFIYYLERNKPVTI